MRIRRFRSVVSVILALALLAPNGLLTVRQASAQAPTGYGAAQVPGAFGYGFPMGGGFGGFGTGTDLGYGFTPMPYPIYPQPQQQQQLMTGQRSDGTRSAARGLCSSQTYQPIMVNTKSAAEIQAVAAVKGNAPKADDKGDKQQDRSEAEKDSEMLSPIEAAFQLPSGMTEPLDRVVFETPRTSTQDLVPYVPVSVLQEKERAAADASRPISQSLPVYGPPPGAVAPNALLKPRFLGPFGMPLRQYGYAVFSSYVSTFAPVDDVPVGPDYVVGPGDTLTVSMWGPLENNIVRTVDRNGQIFLPKIGDVRVWGLTFAQADRLIREQMGRYFRGFQTSVTMGRLRTVRVQVIGEVCQPGSYTLTSLATLTQALYAAGGPTKLGSLRSVRLLRNSHVVGEIDLYDFLLRGDRSRDFRLEAGDTLFVPTIGDVVAVTGEVKRPAIYETRPDVRLADLIEAAGGATPTSYLKRVQIVRAQPSAERVTVDVDLSQYYLKGDMQANPPVHAGDLVLVHKNESRIYNTVKLDGAVKYPGIYELKPMMRLSQLVSQDVVLPETYTERVEIARRRPDYSVEVLTVNLKQAWTGDRDQDLLLRANDEVTLRTEKRETRIVVLNGQVQRPGVYVIAEGERLSSVLERAGGFTARASLKGAVFTRSSLKKVEQEQLNAFVRVQEQRILAEASSTVAGSDKEDSAVSAGVVQARREFLKALTSRVALGRVVINLASPNGLKGSHEDVVLADGDSLDVPEPVDSVLVLGSVRTSTSVLHSPGSGVDYYVNRVGGYAKEADKKEVHIARADGSAVSGFSNIRTVEPGDTIIVPRSEESKYRLLPTLRDGFSILGGTLSAVLSLAALAVLF